jgi:hypothetical protein
MKFLPVVALVLLLVPAVTLSSCSEPGRLSDQAICGQINSRFYYPRVPPGGVRVSRASAIVVAGLLNDAQASTLRDELSPLRDAITARDETDMVQVFSYLADTACPTVGVSPPT